MLEFGEGNLNSIIELSYKVAEYYLRTVHQENCKILNYTEDEIRDIAIDAITPLFTKEGNNVLPIINAYNNWHPVIETEEELKFFINKVVSTRVEQHITKSLKETDPLFDTIFNSINYLVRRSGNGKTKYIGNIYLTESGTKKIDGKAIDREAFCSIPGSHFSDDRNLLQNLFFYLKTETEYSAAIPLIALVLKFKELKSSGYNFVEKVEVPVKTYKLEEFVNRGLIAAKDKLDLAYVRKKKLSKDEGQKLFDALKNMSNDLKNGGVITGLYEYLKLQFNDLSAEEYKRKYHNIIEYLFKVMRVAIANELKK